MARILVGWTDAHYVSDAAGNAKANAPLEVQLLADSTPITDLEAPTGYTGQAFPAGQARSDASGFYGFTVPDGTGPVRVRTAAVGTTPAGGWVTPGGQVLAGSAVAQGLDGKLGVADASATYAPKTEKGATPLRRGELQFNIRDYGAVGNFDNATTAIANAIAAAKAATASAATFGAVCVVHVPGGDYETAPFTLPTKVVLRGEGRRSRLSPLDGTATGPFISLEADDTYQVTIEKLALSGRKDFQTNPIEGIYLDQGDGSTMSPWPDGHHILRDLFIHDFTSNGVNIGNVVREAHLENVVVRRVNGHGFTVTGTDNKFIGCIAASVADGKNGFNIADANNRFVGCKAFFCGTLGTASDGWLVTASRNIFTACEAQDNGRHGFHFTGGAELNSGSALLADSNGGSGFRFDDTVGQLRHLAMVGMVSLTRTGGRYTQVSGYEFVNTPQQSVFVGTSRANTADVTGDPGDSTTIIHTTDGTGVLRFTGTKATARFVSGLANQIGAYGTVATQVGAALASRDDSNAAGTTSAIDMRLGFRGADGDVTTTMTKYAAVRAYRASDFAQDIELALMGFTSGALVERLRIEKDGKILLSGLARVQAGPGGTLRSDVGFRSNTYTTAARPSAVTLGAGTMIYDSTLSKPVWSDGAAWRDAAGAVV